QNTEVSKVLDRVHASRRRLFKWMRLTLEDSADVIFRLYHCIVEETIRARNIFLHAVCGNMIEDREQGVDYQHNCNHVMDRDHAAERERAEDIWSMDDQAGEEQDDDGKGLKPVPEATVRIIHVHTFGSRWTFGLLPRCEVSQRPMTK